MADFAALQQKYAPVVDTIKKFEPYGAKFDGSELVGEQYHLVAHVLSKVVLNRGVGCDQVCGPAVCGSEA